MERGGELRSKDTSGNEKTIVLVDSSNELAYGWSGAGAVKFMGGGSYTERMRIHTDGNVGIGTSAPSVPLTVNNSTDHSDIAIFHAGGGTPNRGLKISTFSSTNSNAGVELDAQHATGAFKFSTGGTERMRIHTDGNVGIGETNSANLLHVKASDTGITPHASAQIVLEREGTNYLQFLTAENGTSGILFGDGSDVDVSKIYVDHNTTKMMFVNETAETMVLNGSNVGIGTASPVRALQVGTHGTGNGEIALGSATNGVGSILFGDGASGADIYRGYVQYNHTADALLLATNAAERMRIDSTGRVGINRTPAISGSKLEVGGADNVPLINVEASGVTGGMGIGSTGLQLFHGSSARMRIDSSGHVLVGKSSAAVATQGTEIRSNGEFFSTIGNGVTTLHVYSTAGAYRFYVTGAGQIHATSTSISSLSDERLKENIVDLETGLSEVMALQPRRFDWKNGDKTNVAGFIAQEVETVLPDLIDGFKDESIEDAKGVRMGDMLPTLVKAIQEQQTIIDDLKSRIETLEE